MEHLSYEGGCGLCISRQLKKKYFQFSNNIIQLYPLSYQRIKLKIIFVVVSTIKRNCEIQLFHGTMKYCYTHTC